ncbi:transcription factor GTE8-like [Mercurialis annua]|uniref:transcription factor GTE8-like n=1 Tax=Mercurialis annua TaxID=3986 RepID=UPI00215E8E84|nr:transcription factor GTE8-like [Mercurialis annua]
MTMAKNGKVFGGFYGNAIETTGELEGSGSSGRIDTENIASEGSSALTRKCINLSSNKMDSLGVPLQVLSLSRISRRERKELIRRLRLELEHIRVLQKKVDVPRTNAGTLSSSSDILSCSNGTNGPRATNFKKSSVMTSATGKKTIPSRSSSGRFKPAARQASAPTTTTNAMAMKQCEILIGRLMSHQYSWVFNEPVDVVKWNIPDYYTIIKKPMDLGTIKTKLSSGSYSSPLEFAADVRLTFKNSMEYNPKGHDAHVMAATLSKFFEVRWKNIEKKLPKAETQTLAARPGPSEDLQIPETSPIKKRKLSSYQHEAVAEPVKRVMTDTEKQALGSELESLLGDLPVHIIDFLKDNSSNGGDTGEDEIEIDIDDLSDDTLFTLRKLLDDYVLEKQKNQARAEPSEMELMNESGISNSTMQEQKGNDAADEDVDIGGNEPPVSSYPPVEIEKDAGHKNSKCISLGISDGSDSDGDSDDARASSPITAMEVTENLVCAPDLHEKSSAGDHLERNEICPESVSGLDQLEQTSQQKPSSDESDCHQDGGDSTSEIQVSPGKLRAAMIKNRFFETIIKAREKTLSQVDKADPDKLRQEMEELELHKKKEKARLQAEAKAAEDAQRRAEAAAAAAAAAEARRQRELEREAARQALLKMEKTVEINENSRLLEDLEMLRGAPAEHLPSSVDETSPEHSQDGLGSFKFGGSNALEQFGLFMKQDEEEEEGEPLNLSKPVNDIEEGEID